MPRSLLRITLLTLLLNVGFVYAGWAQHKISIDSVEKFTFFSSAPFWNASAYYRYEIVPEHLAWNIYQLEVHAWKGSGEVNDTVRKFVRAFPEKDLRTLLKLIAKQDTGINPDLFKFTKERLMVAFDELLPYLKPRERAVIAEWVSPKKIRDSIAIDAIRRSQLSDRKTYQIIIHIKSGKNYGLSAYANGDVYGHLPWTIGKLSSYDPRISAVFDSVIKEAYSSYPLKRLYGQMAFWPFMYGFQTKLAMDILRSDHPLAYRSLTSSFIPETVRDNNYIHQKARRPADSLFYHGTFKVKGMPDHFRMAFNFKPNDTATIHAKKLYLDTVRSVIDKVELFGRLTDHPKMKLTVQASAIKYYGKDIFASLAKHFPDILKYDPDRSHLIQIAGDPAIRSLWILLPDNSLILYKFLYNRTTSKKEDTHFTGLQDDLVQKYFGKQAWVCIHLDPTGKLIKDYGEVPELDALRGY